MKMQSNKNQTSTSQLQELENKIALYTNLRSVSAWAAIIFTLSAILYLIFIS
ncbi:hypothetical protein [Tenacibaculum holothuriorum]|uniref:hypothetical protein n=1 Tax=Tenacibaculum holothuriorum TaxID=1635173 RepID=UPI001302A0DE|nr:hypothetical protein [Tenacibaculum holothuriorum]